MATFCILNSFYKKNYSFIDRLVQALIDDKHGLPEAKIDTPLTQERLCEIHNSLEQKADDKPNDIQLIIQLVLVKKLTTNPDPVTIEWFADKTRQQYLEKFLPAQLFELALDVFNCPGGKEIQDNIKEKLLAKHVNSLTTIDRTKKENKHTQPAFIASNTTGRILSTFEQALVKKNNLLEEKENLERERCKENFIVDICGELLDRLIGLSSTTNIPNYYQVVKKVAEVMYNNSDTPKACELLRKRFSSLKRIYKAPEDNDERIGEALEEFQREYAFYFPPLLQHDTSPPAPHTTPASPKGGPKQKLKSEQKSSLLKPTNLEQRFSSALSAQSVGNPVEPQPSIDTSPVAKSSSIGRKSNPRLVQ